MTTSLLIFAAMLFQAPPATQSADFNKWWPQFQGAVAKNDGATVGRGAAFPLDWENGAIRKIPSQAELMAHFDMYFTPELKKMIATKKPERFPNGGYSITWKARGNEYAVAFKPQGGTFVLDYLSEGPA